MVAIKRKRQSSENEEEQPTKRTRLINIQHPVMKTANLIHIWSSKSQTKENPNLTEDYTTVGKAGEGGFGQVFYARRNFDNKLVAIKVIEDNPYMEKANFAIRSVNPCIDVVPTEVNAMIDLKGVNGVVQVLDVYRSSDSVYILVMESSEHIITLKELMKVRGMLSESDACHYFKQVVRSLSSMYKRKRHHFDIKDTNILINPEKNKATVIDFGGSQKIQDMMFKKCIGTTKYFPPEWKSHGKFNGVAFESWTLGLLLFYMTTGVRVYTKTKLDLTAPRQLSPDLYDLIRDCLSKDPQRRPTLQGILNSQWIGRMKNTGPGNY